SRLEAWTLSAALLSRVLHRLFQLNASYFESCPPGERWSPATLFHASPPHLFMAAAAGAAAVPPSKEASGYQEKGGIPLPRLLDASAAAASSAKEPCPVAQELDPQVTVTAVDLESLGGSVLSDVVHLLISLLRQSTPVKPLVSAVGHV
ncbi:unnamed protein product, partial [Ectocarpus sp. 12 AP-2014]